MDLKDINKEVLTVAEEIINDYQNKRDVDRMDILGQPDNDVVVDVLNKLMNILFPGYYRDKKYFGYSYNNRQSVLIEDVFYHLQKQIDIALKYSSYFQNKTGNEIKDASEIITLNF